MKSYDYSEVLYEREPEVLDTIEIAPENLNAVLEGMRLVAAEGGTTYRFFKDPVSYTHLDVYKRQHLHPLPH